jgi:hypothetical protein
MEEDNVKNILIIGNGFDLVHGLKTRYTDFLRAAKDKTVDDNGFRTLVRDNIWIEYFLSITNLDDDRGWIDFENEIGKVIKDLDELLFSTNSKTKIKSKKSIFGLATNFFIINGDQVSIKSDIDKNKCIWYFDKNLRRLIRAFEIYLIEMDNKIKPIYNSYRGEYYYHHSLIKLDFDYVLSFNYTDTYEGFYAREKVPEYCYIHGKAQRDIYKTNMVLGIDEYLDKDKQNSDFAFVEFKKYYQRIVKKTGSEYSDWLKQDGPFEIYILGHSLGETDHDILREFFEHENAKITVCYHDEDHERSVIENTIKILNHDNKNGREELIRRVHGSDWSIRFVDQYDTANGGIMEQVRTAAESTMKTR